MEIYIVEDDRTVINILEDIIETNGLGTVCGTSGGQPADMEEIVRLNPDVVLVDFLMPEKDGIQLVRELKEAGCGSRFIMISQVSAKELIGKAYSAGIDFFISKPINIIEVKSVIENVERQIQNERTLSNIRKMFLAEMKEEVPEEKKKNDGYVKKLQVILNRIGMSGEKGCDDIIKICQYLHANHKPISQVSIGQLCEILSAAPKNMEQRSAPRHCRRHGESGPHGHRGLHERDVYSLFRHTVPLRGDPRGDGSHPRKAQIRRKGQH